MIDCIYNDGGRSAVFDTPGRNDCVTRALAIVTGLPYMDIWNGIHATGSVGRTGLVDDTVAVRKYIESLGLMYIPNEAYFKDTKLPPRAICCMRGHYFAVLDGCIHDVGHPTRGGRVYIKGYWMPKPVGATLFNVCSVVTGVPFNRCPLNLEQATNMARLMLLNYKRVSNIIPHEKI
jgi:hypothetical protein